MRWLLFLSPLVLAVSAQNNNAEEQPKQSKVTATAGGIVKEGDNVTLTYNVGKEWFSCYWFWYVTEDEYNMCNFDSKEDGTAELRRCEPASMADLVEYTGTDPNECTITVFSVTKEENGTWAARLDTELNTHRIDLIVAQDVQSAEISFGENADVPEENFKADKNSTVRCLVTGGMPAPSVSLEIDGFNKTKIVSSAQTQEMNEEGVYITEQIFIILPDEEDDGRKVSCQAGIVDGDDELVFDLVKAEPKELSVIYPPTEAANQTVKGGVGETAEASFVFMANPEPTDAVWSISVTNEGKNRRNKTEGEEGDETDEGKTDSTEVEILSVKAGETGDKYNASEIIDEGDSKYRVTLQIKNLTMEDAEKDYSVEVKNDVDKTVYYFKVQVKDEDDEGGKGGGDDDDDDDDDEEEEEGGGAATAVFVVLAVICVIAIILGAFFVYKKKRVNNETAPLRN